MAGRLSLLSSLVCTAMAQSMGKMTPEVHPMFPSWECTVKSGCVQKNTSLVIDSDYRWFHTAEGTDNCKPNGLDPKLLPRCKNMCEKLRSGRGQLSRIGNQCRR